jgi:hypothetical protein
MPIRKYSNLLALLFGAMALFFFGCSTSPTKAGDPPKLGKKIALSGFSGNSVDLARGFTDGANPSVLAKIATMTATDPLADTIHLGELRALVPFSFIVQNVGDEVIGDLRIYSGDSLVVIRRSNLGVLDIPAKQALIPIMELAVLTYGTHPWASTVIPAIDTGYGQTTLTFTDGPDDTIAVFVIDYRAMLARFSYGSATTDGKAVPVSNRGNCTVRVRTIFDGVFTIEPGVIDTLIPRFHDRLESEAGLLERTVRSDCQGVEASDPMGGW